VDLANEMLLKN